LSRSIAQIRRPEPAGGSFAGFQGRTVETRYSRARAGGCAAAHRRTQVLRCSMDPADATYPWWRVHLMHRNEIIPIPLRSTESSYTRSHSWQRSGAPIEGFMWLQISDVPDDQTPRRQNDETFCDISGAYCPARAYCLSELCHGRTSAGTPIRAIEIQGSHLSLAQIRKVNERAPPRSDITFHWSRHCHRRRSKG
jgi:hypothetical protein